jgi:DNA-binding transcriptional LysR family regulator
MHKGGPAILRGLAWDDLRIFLAVAEAGSLNAAAKLLAVNHTTVLRRIAAFEARVGVRLFERLPTGYLPTPAGDELLAAARSMAETVAAVERKVSGQDLRLEGEIRVTTTDTIALSLLPELLDAFRTRYPGVVVDIAMSNAFANLTKRDADVAIRPAGAPPEMLIGRKVATIAFAAYAAPTMASSFNARSFAAHPWLMPDDTLAGTAVAAWFRARHPKVQSVLRADSFVVLRDAARAGLGYAVLPCYLGDLSPGLARAAAPIKGLTTDLWLLTHEDLRRTARVRAFLEVAGEMLAARRSLIAGG